MSATNEQRSNVQIVTDSSCDLPTEVVDRLGITVVPLWVRFGSEEFRDRVDLSIDDFWRRCAEEDELPQTAAPSAGVFEQTFRDVAAGNGSDGGDAAKEPKEIVAVILSGALSATIEAAHLGAQAVSDTITVRVIDSRFVSIAHGLLVKLAAELAMSGASAAEIETALDDARPRTSFYATLDTLENLRKGGRIGAAQSLLGSVLSIKPLIKITDGEVKPDGRQRTRAKALAHLRGLVVEALANDEAGDSPGNIEELAVIHAAASDVDDFVGELASLVDSEILVSDVGPVVSVHSGIGAIGVAIRTRSGSGQHTDLGQDTTHDERN